MKASVPIAVVGLELDGPQVRQGLQTARDWGDHPSSKPVYALYWLPAVTSQHLSVGDLITAQ